jgi:hypothetical protein
MRPWLTQAHHAGIEIPQRIDAANGAGRQSVEKVSTTMLPRRAWQ